MHSLRDEQLGLIATLSERIADNGQTVAADVAFLWNLTATCTASSKTAVKPKFCSYTREAKGPVPIPRVYPIPSSPRNDTGIK